MRPWVSSHRSSRKKERKKTDNPREGWEDAVKRSRSDSPIPRWCMCLREGVEDVECRAL